MPTMSRNHKPLPERDVDPAEIPRLVAAARRLPGVGAALARGLGGWLVAVHAGLDDPVGPSTVSRYRRILRELADAGEFSPPPKEGGYATIRTIGTAAALAVTALSSMRGNAPVALASLYITESGGDGADQELLAA